MSEQQNSLKIHRLPFTQVPNHIICSNELSVMAKTLWSVFYSKPDNWTFYWKEIENNFKEGRDAVRNGARQLEQLGYLKKTQKKINSGKGVVFGGMEIELFPYPNQQINPSGSNTENPYTRNSVTGESNSTSSDSSKAVTYKDLGKKDLSKKDSSSFPTIEEAKNFAEEEELKIDVEKWYNHSKHSELKNWKQAMTAWAKKSENQVVTRAIDNQKEVRRVKELQFEQSDIAKELQVVILKLADSINARKWFEDVKVSEFSENLMVIRTNSKFNRDWIDREYGAILSKNFSKKIIIKI